MTFCNSSSILPNWYWIMIFLICVGRGFLGYLLFDALGIPYHLFNFEWTSIIVFQHLSMKNVSTEIISICSFQKRLVRLSVSIQDYNTIYQALIFKSEPFNVLLDEKHSNRSTRLGKTQWHVHIQNNLIYMEERYLLNYFLYVVRNFLITSSRLFFNSKMRFNNEKIFNSILHIIITELIIFRFLKFELKMKNSVNCSWATPIS